MAQRDQDWLRQAERDREQAEASRQAGRHEWACFAAQQAAKMTVKGLHLSLGQEAWGYVVRRLLEELPKSVAVPSELLDAARVLDVHYLPTRYPNGHASGAPGEHYGSIQSGEAVRYAGQILEFCDLQMARP